ncbi:hypothetical protein FBQ82_12550 [Anaerolineae bacterium CFX7]|nr:hypothetical protein [Anaerolineae bacterium CFX7]
MFAYLFDNPANASPLPENTALVAPPRARANNFNKLYGNLCSAPSFNCFEITDAQGIEFDNNSATLTPDNTSGCEIWLVRAQIISGKNNRVPQCNHRGSHLESYYEPGGK